MDTGNSRKKHNIEKSGVVGHLDLPGGRSPKEEKNSCQTKSMIAKDFSGQKIELGNMDIGQGVLYESYVSKRRITNI